jgi:hypothetical protein
VGTSASSQSKSCAVRLVCEPRTGFVDEQKRRRPACRQALQGHRRSNINEASLVGCAHRVLDRPQGPGLAGSAHGDQWSHPPSRERAAGLVDHSCDHIGISGITCRRPGEIGHG